MSKVVLTEEIEFADFEKYEKLVAQLDVTEIDISQFSIKDRSYEEFEEEFDTDFRQPSLLAKLVLNKEFATSFVIENGFVYSLDKRVLVCCQTNRGFVAPYDVEIIGHYAFCNKHIYSVSFPQTLKLIGNHAFEDNDELEEVVLPNSVTHLGECCFYSCGIENLKLSNNLEYIPGCCFCFNELKDVDIPASVKKIDASAFSGNLIRRVVLPEGVESIESDALSTPEYVWLPSTIRWIDKEFFCETPIEDPEDCIPYIDVDERNPLFFCKDGTLYKRDNPKEPYLGYPYSGYKWDGKMDDV